MEAIYAADTAQGNSGYDETQGIDMNPSWLLTALLQGDDVTTYVNGQLDQYK